MIRRTSRSESVSSVASSTVPTSAQDSPILGPMPSGTSNNGISPSSAPDQDEGMSEEVRTAIAALGIMRRGASSNGATPPAPSVPQPAISNRHPAGRPDSGSRSASTASSASFHSWSHQSGQLTEEGSTAASSPMITGSEQGELDEIDPNSSSNHSVADPKFISRVSQLPVISGGLEWYGKAKDSSRVVKYGAGLVESSLSAVSRPITNNLQPSLDQLDDFACRQLDRLGKSPSESTPGLLDSVASRRSSDRKRAVSTSAARGRESVTPHGNSGSENSGYFERPYPENGDSESQEQTPGAEQAVAITPGSRSRWQTVLLEAGGLGAAVSEESLKSLRYCLQWLLYATAHLDHQIMTLRDFIMSLQRHASEGSAESDALVTASATAHLSQIKHDVVETIRKVVDVVSKYAGVALPEQAKRYVRQSILGLPVKWASAIGDRRDSRGTSVGASDSSTPLAERMEDPNTSSTTSASPRDSHDAPRRHAILGQTEDAAERVLTFAVEGLDTLRAVTSIFGESIQKAEDWIERLRIIGLDRQRQRDAGAMMPPPPPSHEEYAAAGTKRRRAAITRDSDEALATGVDSAAGNGDVNADQDSVMTRRRKGVRSRESTVVA